MKLRIIVFLSVLLLLALLLPSSGFAQVSSYNTGIQVQNLSDSETATIVITFYNPDGTEAGSVPDTIAPNDSNVYFPLPGLSSGFNGSAVISADQELAAVANVLGDSVQGSSYTGFSEGASILSLPIINKANFGIDTWFSVQNAGSSDTTVTVSYSDEPTCNEQSLVKPNAAATFDQALNTCLPNGYIGAATVTASGGGSIVASAIQNAPAGLFAYSSFASGSTDPVFPLVAANIGAFDTAIQIQNQGGTASDVTVSYTPVGPGNGTACTETKNIAAGGAEIFTLYAFSVSGPAGTNTCTFGEYFNGSAEVTANSTSQPLVGVVNQTNFVTKGSAYNSFDQSVATDTVVMPIIIDAYSIWSGYNVMNVGSGSTTVTCKYTGLSATYDDSETLAVGQAMNRVQLNSGFPANTSGGYVGSATCTSTGSVPIVGVVNQANSSGGSAGNDTTLTYEAFNN